MLDNRPGVQEHSALPIHIGIIMDGNGRWAKKRNQPRSFGHKEGLNAAKRIIQAASEIGISYATLYVFSTENWKRSNQEVSYLMQLLMNNIKREYPFYKEHNIKILHSGSKSGIPAQVYANLQDAVEFTKNHTGLTVNLAINYGGHDEIVRSVNKTLQEMHVSGNHQLTVDDISSNLDQPDIPFPDLVIRTAGEKRLSNFFIWQCAYSELFFSDKLWPDWTKQDLLDAITSYQKRDRRFGGVS